MRRLPSYRMKVNPEAPSRKSAVKGSKSASILDFLKSRFHRLREVTVVKAADMRRKIRGSPAPSLDMDRGNSQFLDPSLIPASPPRATMRNRASNLATSLRKSFRPPTHHADDSFNQRDWLGQLPPASLPPQPQDARTTDSITALPRRLSDPFIEPPPLPPSWNTLRRHAPPESFYDNHPREADNSLVYSPPVNHTSYLSDTARNPFDDPPPNQPGQSGSSRRPNHLRN